MKIMNLVDQKFGRLTVVEKIRDGLKKRTNYRCVCDCGKETIVFHGSLVRGLTRSCGCFRIEESIKRNKIIKNPNCHHHLYKMWLAMISRCHLSSDQAYINYGGRGIIVCERWRTFFSAFISDMGDRPTSLHTIDRINNDLGYFKENCRWVTMKEQNNNKRDNVVIEFNREKHNITQWAEILGIPRNRLYSRHKRGWSAERMLSHN